MDDLLTSSVAHLGQLLDARRLSPVELTRATLARVGEVDGRLGAFATVCADRALDAAKRAEGEIVSGGRRGPLHGIPVAIKDNVEIEGLPLRAGSAALRDYLSTRNGAVVERLEDAGAIIIGKTAMDEFAFGTLGSGMRNPLDETRSPGGSSGGSAIAVATGMSAIGIGTDTGGSIRIPAACCGIVGLKPTYRLINTAGVIPLAWSVDHVGVLARYVEDVQLVLAILAAYPRSSSAPHSGGRTNPDIRDLRGMTIGVPRDSYLETVDPVIIDAFSAALAVLTGMGATEVPIVLPSVDSVLDFHVLIVLAEAAAYHLSRSDLRMEDYGERVQAMLQVGGSLTARDYLNAQRLRGRLIRDLSRAFDGIDIIGLPTLALFPPRIGEREVVLAGNRRTDAITAMVLFTCSFDHSGHPAVSVPITTETHLPAGLQLVGKRFRERHLLRVAAAFEAGGQFE